MGTVKIGTECCNNCIHWECRSREIEGNPPADVRVYSDYNKCSISGSQTAWRDCCGMFKHIGGVKNTFQADRSSMLTPGEAYLKSVTEYVQNRRREREEARIQEESSVTTCSLCNGTGRSQCTSCGGRGKKDCPDCDGKGGFSVTLQIKEHGKKYSKRTAWLLKTEVDGGFWKKGWDWDNDPGLVAKFGDKHVVCSKACKVPGSASAKRKIQEEVLKVSMVDGDFHLPAGLSDTEQEKTLESFLKIFNNYIDKCKDVEESAKKWGDDGFWGHDERIKEASLNIVETPCFVQVKFTDRYGFNRTTLVNLASKKVYLNEVSEEERKRRMPELEAEAANDADLQNAIGQMYGNYPKFKGYAPKDEELAAGWFMRAAKNGHADAMDNLGNCYKSGDGVEKDAELAAAWYAKAAKKGLPWGQFHYADVLEDGKGVPKDDELAVAWYLKAAKQGLADAQWRLGCRIADGRGTEKDKELGEAWKERAKANGFVPPRSSGW